MSPESEKPKQAVQPATDPNLVPNESVDASTNSESSHVDTVSTLFDKDGKAFDPNYHQTKDDGTPKLTKSGHCMRPFGGKGKKKSNSIPATAPPHLKNTVSRPSFIHSTEPVATGEQSQVAQKPINKLTPRQAAAAGKATAGAVEKISVMIAGPTFTMVKTSEGDEKKEIGELFANYYEEKGKADVSPTIALLFGLGMYYGVRVTNNEIMDQVKKDSKVVSWFGEKMAKFKAWRVYRKEMRKNKKLRPAEQTQTQGPEKPLGKPEVVDPRESLYNGEEIQKPFDIHNIK